MPAYSGLNGLIQDHEAAQAEMIEEQVDTVLFTTGIDWILAPDKGEAYAQFNQELAQVLEQASFKITLVRVCAQRESQNCKDL